MRFYIVVNGYGSTIGCEKTLAKAHATARRAGAGDAGSANEEYEIHAIDCPVNAETVRLLLGELGGYATESKCVFPKSEG